MHDWLVYLFRLKYEMAFAFGQVYDKLPNAISLDILKRGMTVQPEKLHADKSWLL